MAGVGKNKVKVEVAALLAAIKDRRSKLATAFQEADAKYKSQVEEHREKVASEIEAYANRVRAGSVSPDYGYGSKKITVPLRTSRLERPSEPNLNALDRMIKTLEMAAEETILISADDFAVYLG